MTNAPHRACANDQTMRRSWDEAWRPLFQPARKRRNRAGELRDVQGAVKTAPAASAADALEGPDSEYKGWTIPQHGSLIPSIRITPQTDPRDFFRDYIATRKPCLLRQSRLSDKSWRADQLWNNNYMRRVAGKSTVRVERRGGRDGGSLLTQSS